MCARACWPTVCWQELYVFQSQSVRARGGIRRCFRDRHWLQRCGARFVWQQTKPFLTYALLQILLHVCIRLRVGSSERDRSRSYALVAQGERWREDSPAPAPVAL